MASLAALAMASMLTPPILAEVVANTDAIVCSTIAEHQEFVDAMKSQDWTWEYPPSCVELPTGGRRLGGPLERREAPWLGTEKATFVLIEIPGKGTFWALASWVDEVGPGSEPTQILFLSDAQVWYAKTLRARFGNRLRIQDIDYEADTLPCLPRDITRFDMSTGRSGSTLVVEGSVSLGPIPEPFRVVDGAQGPRYLLILQAYLFSPSGRLVWQQSGYPRGDAWVSSSGQSVDFRLAGTLRHVGAHELLVVAAGDPLLSSASEVRVLLGAKQITIP